MIRQSPMIDDPVRRRLLQLSLAALPAISALGLSDAARAEAAAGGAGPVHNFDFFLGDWTVRHRRLRQRLAGSDDWEEFDGTTSCRPILGGAANFNDSVSWRAGGVSRGLGLRAYDAKADTWADWYLAGGDPGRIDPPGVGRFAGGRGTFFSDDVHAGRPVRVRGIFSCLSPTVAQWEQAFSPDGGATWETNWIMRYARTA